MPSGKSLLFDMLPLQSSFSNVFKGKKVVYPHQKTKWSTHWSVFCAQMCWPHLACVSEHLPQPVPSQPTPSTLLSFFPVGQYKGLEASGPDEQEASLGRCVSAFQKSSKDSLTSWPPCLLAAFLSIMEGIAGFCLLARPNSLFWDINKVIEIS